MSSVLFVCLGNICRSPAAEGILKHMVQKDPRLEGLVVESCGMGDWHVGQLPDSRIREAANARGVVLVSRAQHFKPQFLEKFDYILAADHEVLNDLYKYAHSSEQKAKIHLITYYSPTYRDQEVPDPYYKGEAAFERVLDMLEDSCEGLVAHLLQER